MSVGGKEWGRLAMGHESGRRAPSCIIVRGLTVRQSGEVFDVDLAGTIEAYGSSRRVGIVSWEGIETEACFMVL